MYPYHGYSLLFLSGTTRLHIAANFGLEFIVSLLLARDDVDVNSKDEYSQTALSWAISK
jgi:ankyrin repeat protein